MVSFYWGGAMVGRFIGSGLLFLVKQRAPWLLAVFALVCRGVVPGGDRSCTVRRPRICALSIGLFNSIMFPVIFTLDARALHRASPAATSGLLCLAIVGGAILPYMYGLIADAAGLHAAYFLPAVAYLADRGIRGRARRAPGPTSTAPRHAQPRGTDHREFMDPVKERQGARIAEHHDRLGELAV